MSTITLTNNTISNALWDSRSMARSVVLAVVGSLGIWVSAKIQVPFFPVPITMQTFIILSLGMIYGWKLGLATIILYMVEGGMGLPVFAGTPEKGIGWLYMMGPTGGYLLGFVLSVVLVGYLAEKKGWDKSIVKTILAMVMGNAVIYALGLLWLGAVLGWDKPILQWGLFPFLIGDAFKIMLAAFFLPFVWKLIKRKDQHQ